MAVPTNKEELQKATITNYDKLKKDLLMIPPELTKTKELDGHSKGTFISVNNLISYLIGWGELVLRWNRKKDNNEQVDFPEMGYKWNKLGELAKKFYTDYQNDDYLSLLENWKRL